MTRTISSSICLSLRRRNSAKRTSSAVLGFKSFLDDLVESEALCQQWWIFNIFDRQAETASLNLSEAPLGLAPKPRIFAVGVETAFHLWIA